MKNTTFFGIDFYPTPQEVINRMLSETDIMGKYVLEPSAGSGNIVDELNRRGAAQVSACEIDPKLRKVLSGKCTLIADDFLTVTSEQVSHIDLIVMNPPFSSAGNHILHAYEIAPEGCEIISLCNDAMVNRGYWASEKQRRIDELIKNYGLVDEYGKCFKNADRTTDCDIACIHLWKPKTGDSEFDNYFFDDISFEENNTVSGIMPYNAIRDIVNRYVEAVKRYDVVMEASKGINELTSIFERNPITFGAKYNDSNKHYREINRDTFRKELQKAAWLKIFDEMNMERYVTKSVREDINRYVERQVNAPFTMRNIYRMLEMIVGTHENRMTKTLVEAFDTICSFSAENSTAGEKWKTNSDYMINKRFIVPCMTEYYRWGSYNKYVDVSGYRADNIEDVIRALCYITGTPYESTCSLKDFVGNNNLEWGKWYTMGKWSYKENQPAEWVSGFFKIRGYKKGTMHFEFIDEDVWAKFNIAVAKIKGWQLPKQAQKKRSKK